MHVRTVLMGYTMVQSMLNFVIACAHLDPLAMVKAGGYLGIAFIIFAESGLLVGIFLPGDSLLFIAGLLAAGGYLEIGPLVAIVVIAAILGDSVGYWFGANVGENLYKRRESRFFKKEYLRRTEKFYDEYGARAVFLARFMPILRTLAPILAGVGNMRYGRFVSYNAVGGLVWGAGLTLLGFFLGAIIPNSETYVFPMALVIIVLSFLPIFLNVLRGRKAV